MKWQKALTKKQLAHMRANQSTLSLRAFKVNRKAQERFTALRNDAGLGGDACHECSMIEFALKQAGKL